MFPPTPKQKWALARFLRVSRKVEPANSNRWRSHFLRRFSADRREQWRFAVRLALHSLSADKPLVFVAGAASVLFLFGVGIGSVLA